MNFTSYPIVITAHTFDQKKKVEVQQIAYNADNLKTSVQANLNTSKMLFTFLFPVLLMVGAVAVEKKRDFIGFKYCCKNSKEKEETSPYSLLNDPSVKKAYSINNVSN